MESIFSEISIVIAIGAAMALVMKFLRQPLIVGHIITGIVVGPAVLGILSSTTAFSGLSSIGVALLLFIIGLDLSLRVFSKLGRVVSITASLQVGLVTWIGFIAARLLDFGRLESLIIGIGLAMSSTIIIVKIFNDKKETTRLYAQIAIGVLLLQDAIATAGKIGLSAKEGGESATDIVLLLSRGVAATALLYIISRYIVPKLTRTLESSKELLLLFALGWGLGFAALFEAAGFSIEIGALFAGVSLASLAYSSEMASRLKPLRDFFIVIFFITLGQSIAPHEMLQVLLPALVFSLIVIIVKPLAVMGTMGFMGYTKRNSFKTGIALGQVSEFSLVFLLEAVSAHLASPKAVTTITLVALITFAVSTYFMKYDDELFEKLQSKLRFFEPRVTPLEQRDAMTTYPVVMFGYKKGGHEFLRTFREMKKKFVVIDYDPDVIDTLERLRIHYLYGDAVDIELLEEIHLEKSKLIVSTISDHKTNLFLTHWITKHNPRAVFVCSADSAEHASDLYGEGAAYVMIPHYIGSEKLSAFISKNGFSKTEFKAYREKHLSYLETHYRAQA